MSQGKAKNTSHWDASHPGEVARDKLRKAIKSGKIEKPTSCQLCEHDDSLIFGHHWRGYAYPYDVWWICPSCNTYDFLRHDGTQTLEQARALVASSKPMSKHEQIDNSQLTAKLDLRRRFLDAYHEHGKVDVLDCCQGSGVIWKQLRDEYHVDSYFGVDWKRKRGRLAIDSKRILAQPNLPQNVIDIDTYGSPWAHWLALLPNLTRPTSVFLTIGDQNRVAMEPGATGSYDVGFPPSTPKVLMGMMGRKIAASILLTKATSLYTIAEATEAIAVGAHARYLGIHLIPKTP
jgi:hypothetical protein